MIIYEPGILLDEADNEFHDAQITLNHPIIGWQALGSAEAEFEEPGYPGVNAFSGATNLFWLSSSIEGQDFNISLDLVAGQWIDYLAIARHNFGTGNIAIDINIDASSVIAEFIPLDNNPLLFRFTSRDGVDNVTIGLQPEYEPPFMAGVYVGKLLVLPRKIYVPHGPITMGRQTKITSGYSESGEFLGRNVTNETFTSGVSLQNLPPLWYREKMDPFLVQAQTNPFFFGWRPQQYPEEVGYCWLTNNPVPTNQRANGMMQVDLKFGGIIF